MENINSLIKQAVGASAIARQENRPTLALPIKEIREAAAKYPAVFQTNAEREIAKAATCKLIPEYSNKELTENLTQMLNLVSFDIGFRKPTDETEWKYIVVRWAEIINKFYKDCTLVDIKTALELSAMGELDDYLPKNANGEPDRQHYQMLSAEYLHKIMRAYKARRNDLVIKVRRNKPKPQLALPPQVGISKSETTRKIFDRYKKTKMLTFGLHEDKVVSDFLTEKGLIKVEVTEMDKKIAYKTYLAEMENNQRSPYEAKWVKREGYKSATLQTKALTIAMRRTIKDYFDSIIKQGK